MNWGLGGGLSVSDGHLFAVAPDQSKTKLKLVAMGAEKLSTVDFKMLEWPIFVPDQSMDFDTLALDYTNTFQQGLEAEV